MPTQSVDINDPKLSEAIQQKLQLRGADKVNTVHRASSRSVSAVIDLCVDTACVDYTTTYAGEVRHVLLDSGLKAS